MERSVSKAFALAQLPPALLLDLPTTVMVCKVPALTLTIAVFDIVKPRMLPSSATGNWSVLRRAPGPQGVLLPTRFMPTPSRSTSPIIAKHGEVAKIESEAATCIAWIPVPGRVKGIETNVVPASGSAAPE
jgi:hypothetical protein